MDVKPAYETFGRDIEFDDITNIRSVLQPGILSKDKFFNSGALKKALNDICWLSDDKILVYFRNIAGGMIPADNDGKRKWWDSFQKFASLLEKNFPVGMQIEYWYDDGNGKNCKPSPEFSADNPPYQAFIKLFDNAIQGFSCFVGRNQEGIRFSSERNNYNTIKSGEAFVHDQKTLWRGTPNALLESAYGIEHVVDTMRTTHKGGVSGYNGNRSEVRIITPRGALVGSLVDDSSVTLWVDNSSLERIAEKYHSTHKRLLATIPR